MFSAESSMKMNLQFVTMYRKLLKQLYKTCHERPHYVQEVRLLLAKPLVEECHVFNKNTKAVGETYIKSDNTTTATTKSALTETATSELPEKPINKKNELFWRNLQRKAAAQSPVGASESMLMYLERPPSECWRIDREQLFLRCKNDLYGEIVHSLCNTKNSKNCEQAVESSITENLQSHENTESEKLNVISDKSINTASDEKVKFNNQILSKVNVGATSKTENNVKQENEVTSTRDRSALPLLAQQLVHYRELVWLRDRLDKVLARATLRRLDQSLCVFDGPDKDDDFISDDYFDNKLKKQQKPTSTESDDALKQRNSYILSKLTESSLPSSHEPLPAYTETVESWPELAATKKERNCKYNQLQNDLYNERSGNEVYSAGALGLQREVFVLRHVEDFPLAKRFLSDFSDTANKEKLDSLHSLEELEWFVHENVPSFVTCRNEEVELCVEVKPFDAKYTHKDQAGVGFFATAHRQFMVHFTLKPIKPANYVQIVNSYFARLDFHSGQLIEEIGYLHSSDIRRLLQERDVPFLYNSNDDDDEDDGNTFEETTKKRTDERSRIKKSNTTDMRKSRNTVLSESESESESESVDKNSNVDQNEMEHKCTAQSTELQDTNDKVSENTSRIESSSERGTKKCDKNSGNSTKEFCGDDDSDMYASDDVEGNDGYIDLDINSSANGKKAQDYSESSANLHSRDFTLFFANMSDGANVLKGALYYKAGSTRSLMHEPIHVLTFGHVLLKS